MDKKYIEYDSLIVKLIAREYFSPSSEISYDELIKLLNSQPVADVQEVVYCKECKFFKTDTFGQKICIRQFNTIRMNDNDFCSYGEKKCGDDNA